MASTDEYDHSSTEAPSLLLKIGRYTLRIDRRPKNLEPSEHRRTQQEANTPVLLSILEVVGAFVVVFSLVSLDIPPLRFLMAVVGLVIAITAIHRLGRAATNNAERPLIAIPLFGAVFVLVAEAVVIFAQVYR